MTDKYTTVEKAENHQKLARNEMLKKIEQMVENRDFDDERFAQS